MIDTRSWRLPLEQVLRWAFAGVALALYLVACLIIVAFQTRQSRTDLEYLLYSEAEGLSAYLAAGGGWDYPELQGDGDDAETPEAVWLRVLADGQVIRQTPTAPAVGTSEGAPEGSLQVVTTPDGARYGVVAHEVWTRPGLQVEAIGRLELINERGRKLLATLVLTGLILIPLATLAARGIAAVLLRPVRHLLREIQAIHPETPGTRLTPGGPIAETAELASEFNALFERIEVVVERMQHFTENASHELRTPLASLRTGIEVTLRRERTPAEYRELLGELLAEIDRMERVVEGLLAIARESDRACGERTEVGIDDVVEVASRTVRPLLTVRGQRLAVNLEVDLVARGDEAQLALLLINLLDNAIKHGPAGSTVFIDGHRRGDEVVLVVRDEGPGVPIEDRPSVFQRRYQGGPRSSRVGGIGLDLVRWIAEAHGGSVRLLETSSGAAFEAVLPAPSAEDGSDVAPG